MATPTPSAAQLIAALYEDPEECAKVAKLRYVSPDEPGLTRLRKGKGFTYRDARGVTVVDVALRDRIAKIAIPPAWKDVWIATWPDAHLLAVGEDERGRRQYIYHERWRSIRDQLNFYRLLGFGDAMPAIRKNVDAQLRRDTVDNDRVLATMLRIMDATGLRVGNEVYAEENDSYGLTTLTKRHVQVDGDAVRFHFPAKSGKEADTVLEDAGVARVVEHLLGQRGRRLFTVDGKPVDSDVVNATHPRTDRRTLHGQGLPHVEGLVHRVRAPAPAPGPRAVGEALARRRRRGLGAAQQHPHACAARTTSTPTCWTATPRAISRVSSRASGCVRRGGSRSTSG